MTARDRVTDLIPYLHVADVAASAAFYGRLGFVVADRREEDGRLVWACLEVAHARLMLAIAGAPVEADRQAMLLSLFVRDLDGLRERLVADGVAVGDVAAGAPRQLRVDDPDGYCLMLTEVRGERPEVVAGP